MAVKDAAISPLPLLLHQVMIDASLLKKPLIGTITKYHLSVVMISEHVYNYHTVEFTLRLDDTKPEIKKAQSGFLHSALACVYLLTYCVDCSLRIIPKLYISVRLLRTCALEYMCTCTDIN